LPSSGARATSSSSTNEAPAQLALICEAFKPRDSDLFDPDPLPRAKAASRAHARASDLSQYTTTRGSPDLEAMREALGYQRWNLWGGSYGTRVAQDTCVPHGDRGVRWSGMVWRTRHGLVLARRVAHAGSGARRDPQACAISQGCAKAHPDVRSTLRRSSSRWGKEGAPTSSTRAPGETHRVRVTFDVVLAALQPLTYAPETTVLLPEMLGLAANGEFAPLFAANRTAAPASPSRPTARCTSR
jgi:pimeloyl-ACP methyl ester carboxylesterase